MSMQVDLRNPELGYFDEGMNLSDAAVYRDACLPFGQATKLPPVAYRSKVFLELESEKVWTRSWVAIGLQQQIPNAG
ncbi:MAG: ring-hydroxylating oxygenase subunit alpha, partial [Hyphomicrobium denitrificans]|nr:ring-hydroxylating oxygenase subunit alpha [Hyphomicrobium denitrificans]